MKTILFICTGNTCRSPMAEVLAKDYEQSLQTAENGIRIISAGICAFSGLPASALAQKVMLELSLDLSAHRTRLLTKDLLTEADLVLTMTAEQQRWVWKMWGHAETQRPVPEVHLLIEYALDEAGQKGQEELAGRRDILDPFGQSVEVYRACAQELKCYLPQVLARFKKQVINKEF